MVDPLLAALDALQPAEVALAVSKIDQGAHPEDRLADLYAVIERLRRRRLPVLMWNQGTLGEACVAAGAAGDETGIGWRERCDLRAGMSDYRPHRPAASAPAPSTCHREARGRWRRPVSPPLGTLQARGVSRWSAR